MKLKEKTQRKFTSYFEKLSNMHNGEEFELAYSDIQQETGAASVTLKRAIQVLAEEGVIEVNPGRNSRCARFKYLLPVQENEKKSSELAFADSQQRLLADGRNMAPAEGGLSEFSENMIELMQVVEHLRRRVRNQEMAISLLQDRLAVLEDKH